MVKSDEMGNCPKSDNKEKEEERDNHRGKKTWRVKKFWCVGGWFDSVMSAKEKSFWGGAHLDQTGMPFKVLNVSLLAGGEERAG